MIIENQALLLSQKGNVCRIIQFLIQSDSKEIYFILALMRWHIADLRAPRSPPSPCTPSDSMTLFGVQEKLDSSHVFMLSETFPHNFRIISPRHFLPVLSPWCEVIRQKSFQFNHDSVMVVTKTHYDTILTPFTSRI